MQLHYLGERQGKELRPEKTPEISRRHRREMTSEKRAQKFHTDDPDLGSASHCLKQISNQSEALSI